MCYDSEVAEGGLKTTCALSFGFGTVRTDGFLSYELLSAAYLSGWYDLNYLFGIVYVSNSILAGFVVLLGEKLLYLSDDALSFD